MAERVFIIAEAGVNHNGSLSRAKKMVDTAVKVGADAVKFQAFKADNLVSIDAPKADYQKKWTAAKENQYQMIKKLELGEREHQILFKYCRKRKILFLSSPFDLGSITMLSNMGVKIFKIPSGELTNLPYLRKIGGLKKCVILSSGMADLLEVKRAVAILIKAGTKRENIIVLHCTTEYPAPVDEVNLKAMLTMGEKLRLAVGYSDHTQGTEIAVAAAAIGARVIEKHFTLNKKLKGPDHAASLEPQELAEMIRAIRNVEAALGDGIKRPSPSEKKNMSVARKSIVAALPISRGERFSEQNITVKRPGIGLSPMCWDRVIGKRAGANFHKDDLIKI